MSRGIDYVDPCRCLECAGACTFKVPKKWFQCNPCSKGYHVGPCESFIEERFPQMQPECARCGYWLEDHYP